MFEAITSLWALRRRKGRFRIISPVRPKAIFQTDYGRFTVDWTRSAVTGSKLRQEIPFEDIVRLDCVTAEKSAVTDEIAMGGFDGKLDVVEWSTILLVLTDGRTVPLYSIGQYRLRAQHGQRFLDMQMNLLLKIGLIRDGRKASSAVLQEMQKMFRDVGQNRPPSLPDNEEAEQGEDAKPDDAPS